jgi:hypothetical protein
MAEMHKLMGYLADTEWTKREILPKLDPNLFEAIYLRSEVHEDGVCPGESIRNYDPLDRKGLKLGKFKLEAFPPSTNDGQKYVEVYLLDSGEISFIQATTTDWDSGKSVSCYGQSGRDTLRQVLLLGGSDSSIVSKNLEGTIIKEIEKENAIVRRIKDEKVGLSTFSWQGECNGLYNEVKSYGTLKEILLEKDINRKILAMQYIAPLIVDLLDEKELEDLSDILKGHLSDNCMCQISPSAPQSDEEDTTTVADAASYALSFLGAYKNRGN